MKPFKRKILFTAFLLGAASIAQANPYLIKYKGLTLGEIDNLTTLKDLYLDAKATNPIVRLLLGKSHYVFYAGKKPEISHAKFRRDKNQLLFALREAITHRPKYKRFDITKDKKLVVACKKDVCNYQYIKKGIVNDSGIILFDEDNQFYKLTEKKSNVVIVKKK
ncbi:MAG: hypothetical protein DSZ05_09665 [Sulfurospirillum sp.]|nr:MAG: hypothetical protein DSZ05_09665 [Sulfurospirillum sp.]